MWIEAGTWNIVFPLITWWKLSPAQLCYRTLASGEFCLLTLSLNWLQGAGGLAWVAVAKKKNRYLNYLNNCFFGTALVNLRSNRLWFFCTFPLKDEMEWTLLAGIAGVKPGTAKKTMFRPENVFSALSLWNSLTPGFEKKNRFCKIVFSVCPVLNLPTPPHYLV